MIPKKYLAIVEDFSVHREQCNRSIAVQFDDFRDAHNYVAFMDGQINEGKCYVLERVLFNGP